MSHSINRNSGTYNKSMLSSLAQKRNTEQVEVVSLNSQPSQKTGVISKLFSGFVSYLKGAAKPSTPKITPQASLGGDVSSSQLQTKDQRASITSANSTKKVSPISKEGISTGSVGVVISGAEVKGVSMNGTVYTLEEAKGLKNPSKELTSLLKAFDRGTVVKFKADQQK